MPASPEVKSKLMDVLKSHGVDDPEVVVSAIYDAGLVVESSGEAKEEHDLTGAPPEGEEGLPPTPMPEAPEEMGEGKMPIKEARGFAVKIGLGKMKPPPFKKKGANESAGEKKEKDEEAAK